MSAPMRTLHVLDVSSPIVAGYTSRTRSLLRAQRNLGMLLPVAVTSVRQGPREALREVVDDVVHYRTEPLATTSAPVAREALEMSALHRRVHDVGRAERASVIHAHSPVLCGIPAHLAARRLDAASVYEVRALWEDAASNQGRLHASALRYHATRALETRLCHAADAVVVICEGLRSELESRGVSNSRLFVVPNGVDTSLFRPMPYDPVVAERLGLHGKIVVGYLGSLFRFEGVARLLEALDRVTREDDQIRGFVVGDGESAEDLRTLHRTLRLGDRVRIVGRVPPSEVSAYYAVADVLCYPRERDRITELTTPLKPLEAMAMGKSVLVSDVGGLTELVENEATGLSFRAGDTEDLARQIRRLTTDAALRRSLGERARRHVSQKRDWATLSRRYLDIYASAIEQRRSGSQARIATS